MVIAASAPPALAIFDAHTAGRKGVLDACAGPGVARTRRDGLPVHELIRR